MLNTGFTGIFMTNKLVFNLKKELLNQLPGKPAQEKMSPTVRFTGISYPDPSNAKASGVLLLIFPDEMGLSTVFIKRTSFGPHGGQISLPGGKREQADPSIVSTALRETNEELGIETSPIKVLGELSSLYVPNSNFNIFPVLGYLEKSPTMVKEDKEVESIIRIGIKQLFHPDNKGVRFFSRSGFDIEAPYYKANGHVIWGATAMILSEFEALLEKTGFLS